MKPRTKLKVAILGCGRFPRRYHVPALESESRAGLSMICDTGIGPALGDVAARTGAALTTRTEDLFTPGACDAVIISTPHALHGGHAGQCLEHGKHVLVDKPFVMRSIEARQLADAAKASGLVGAVAFNRRFDDSCLRARTLIQGGALGEIRYLETVQLGYETQGWFLDPALGGGGPFTGRGAHMADLLPWLLARLPQRVRAVTRPGPAGRADEGGFIEVDFGALRCHLTCITNGLHMWDEIRVFGDKGLIELRRPLDIPLGWQLTHWGTGRKPLETIEADDAPGAATRDFIDAICDEKAAPACTFEQAWNSVRVIELAFESALQEGAWLSV
ncbi:MAG: Gfo/Idh/MocA family oxidoreductase [Betaproteobacteria bacterium]|nr:Gfo/Idh/MocA family oxidoreductase [Betaproteobacteria bacterium]